MAIASIRESVLQLANASPELYEECDLEILRRDDDYVAKFVKLVDSHLTDNNQASRETINEVIKLIDRSLKHRKSSGLCHFSQRDFPREFYVHKGFAMSCDARVHCWTFARFE